MTRPELNMNIPWPLLNAGIIASVWFLAVGLAMTLLQFILVWFPEQRVAGIEHARRRLVMPLFFLPMFAVVFSFVALAFYGLWSVIIEVLWAVPN